MGTAQTTSPGLISSLQRIPVIPPTSFSSTFYDGLGPESIVGWAPKFLKTAGNYSLSNITPFYFSQLLKLIYLTWFYKSSDNYLSY